MRRREAKKTTALKMETLKSTYGQFITDIKRRRLLERESLAFEATELIASLMQEQSISKAELARRVGKSRAYITQLLSGSRNMTMHTFADLTFALGHRAGLRSVSLASVRDERDCVMPYDVASNWLRHNQRLFVDTSEKGSAAPSADEESFALVA